MSSLVELKDACIKKALEVVESIDGTTEDEDEVRAKTVATLVGAACQADAQANNDAWTKAQVPGRSES